MVRSLFGWEQTFDGQCHERMKPVFTWLPAARE